MGAERGDLVYGGSPGNRARDLRRDERRQAAPRAHDAGDAGAARHRRVERSRHGRRLPLGGRLVPAGPDCNAGPELVRLVERPKPVRRRQARPHRRVRRGRRAEGLGLPAADRRLSRRAPRRRHRRRTLPRRRVGSHPHHLRRRVPLRVGAGQGRPAAGLPCRSLRLARLRDVLSRRIEVRLRRSRTGSRSAPVRAVGLGRGRDSDHLRRDSTPAVSTFRRTRDSSPPRGRTWPSTSIQSAAVPRSTCLAPALATRRAASPPTARVCTSPPSGTVRASI